MRFLPRISLPVHGLAELALGITLIVVGFVASLGDTGMLLTLVAGITIAGVGFGAVSDQPLALHQAIDRSIVIGIAVLAVIAAAGGSALAAAILLATSGTMLALETVTHWSRPLV
jgi:hypothetical protein